jgi:hypothetical protein
MKSLSCLAAKRSEYLFLIFIILILLAIPTISPAAGPAGDVDGNGQVELSDAIMALKVLVGTASPEDSSGDVNGDGKIGIAEALYAVQWVAGIRAIKEEWSGALYNNLGIENGSIDFTLKKKSDGTVTADGVFSYLFMGQTINEDFEDQPLAVDGNYISTEYTDTADIPPFGTTYYTVSLDGTTNNGSGGGDWSVDFANIFIPDMSGTWSADRISGGGITE